MAGAGKTSIRIGNVEMKNSSVASSNALFDRRLLDVHMKGVEEQADISRSELAQDIHPF